MIEKEERLMECSNHLMMPMYCYEEFYQWLDQENNFEWLYIASLYWKNEPWKFALNIGLIPFIFMLSFIVLVIPDSYPRIEKAPFGDVDDAGLIWYHLVLFAS